MWMLDALEVGGRHRKEETLSHVVRALQWPSEPNESPQADQCGAVLNLHTSADNLDVRRPRRAAAAAKPGVVLSTTSGAGYPWTARRPFSFDPPISCRASR